VKAATTLGNRINQSINQSINQQINQSISQSVSQSINQSINQSIKNDKGCLPFSQAQFTCTDSLAKAKN